eukprot:10727214-Alexandrium_andersonii.AAC.1
MASASRFSFSPRSLAYCPMPIARALSMAFAGLTPSRCWLSRSHNAAPSMAASSLPAWKSPTSRQM